MPEKQSNKNTLLKHSISLYKQLVDYGSDAIYVTDKNGRIVLSNVAASKMLGYDIDEIVKKTIDEVDFEFSIDQYKQMWASTPPGKTITFETKHKAKDDSIIGIEVTAKKLKIENDEYFYGSARNITNRKINEKALKEQEQQLRNVVENSTNVFFTHDCNNIITYMSPQVIKVLGCTPEEAKVSWATFVTDNPLNKTGFQHTKRAIETGKRQPMYELELKRKDGRLIWVEVREAPVIEYGKVVGITGTLTDISSRKDFENDLIRAKDKAEESDKLKSAFLANMSHEIRTPLNSILGFSDLLDDDELTKDERSQYLKIVRSSGFRMLETVNSLIDISRIETGQVEVTYSTFNWNYMIENLRKTFDFEANEKGLSLSVNSQIPKSDEIFASDYNKIISVLTNLIKNAIKYTNKGGITVNCTLDSQMLSVHIADTGIGVKKQYINAIFNRFEQGENATKKAIQGSGLGLAISKAYVEMLGGRIWVESKLEKGSTFSFIIPIKKTEVL